MPTSISSHIPRSNTARLRCLVFSGLAVLALVGVGRAALFVLELGGFLVVVVGQALAEVLHRAAEAATEVAQARRSEDQRHDCQHDQPVPDAETTHGNTSADGSRRQGYRSKVALTRRWPLPAGRGSPPGGWGRADRRRQRRGRRRSSVG